MTRLVDTEVVVVGGGLAGSAVAACLARRGVPAVLVDPRGTPAPDFRCEKLEASQLALLDRTGLGAAVRAVATPAGALWVARAGRVVERRPVPQVDFRYEAAVRAVRAEVRGSGTVRVGKAVAVHPHPSHPVVQLADGGGLRGRVVLVATGLSGTLADRMGLRRRVLSSRHSVCVGFDLVPEGGGAFQFPALTWYPDGPHRRTAYLTLFPLGEVMRANLFVYRDPRDAWFEALRSDLPGTLRALLPGVEELLGPVRVQGSVRVRASDLTTVPGPERPGVVLIGDAAGTSCPAAGTGCDNVLADAARLAEEFLPRWLERGPVGVPEVRDFYADPERQRVRARSLERAWAVRRQALGTDPVARLRRRAVFAVQGARGLLRGS